MPKVAIIGKDSYIGGHIASALIARGSSAIEVDALNSKWAEFDFSAVDTVVHVAAIVHRKDISDPEVYNEINVEFPVEVAKRAKAAGVKQFIFLSSMAVYGKGHVLKDYCIEPGYPLEPVTEYAKSKLKAEKKLTQVIDGSMILSIIRPPSVYGRGCKGNLFERYRQIADLLPRMPACEPNCLQGVLHIDNLCSAVCAIIEQRKEGCFHPQDSQLLSTVELLCEIRKNLGKKSGVSRALGKAASVFSFLSVYKKLFGSIYYSSLFEEQELLSCPMITTQEGLRRMYHEEA